MRTDDGREVIARLELPLPLDLAAAVMKAVADAAEELGYTDAVVLTDGPHAGCLAATRPGHPHSGPPPAGGGAPTAPDP